MLNFFKKKPLGQKITIKIDGMHCVSCSLNIDGELEDTAGVLEATTSYAKAQTQVEYDPHQIDEEKIKKVIQKLGYKVVS